MKLTITGRIPSKKNSRRVVCRGKHPVSLPSEQYEAWHTEWMYKLKKRKPKKPFEQCQVSMIFYAPDRRKADLSNKAESVMDLLVDAEYLKDDNWFVVYGLGLAFGGVSNDPRVAIEIMGK